MRVTIELSSEEAGEVLVGLDHRTKQVGVVGTQHADEIAEVGRRLCDAFARTFGWGEGVWRRLQANRARVSVRAPRADEYRRAGR